MKIALIVPQTTEEFVVKVFSLLKKYVFGIEQIPK